MDIQIVSSARRLREPGNVFGYFAYVTAAASCLLQLHWRIGFTEFESLVLPVVPWLVNIGLLLKFRTRPLKQYWWVLPSVVLANPLLLLLGFMVLGWSLGGFV